MLLPAPLGPPIAVSVCGRTEKFASTSAVSGFGRRPEVNVFHPLCQLPQRDVLFVFRRLEYKNVLKLASAVGAFVPERQPSVVHASDDQRARDAEDLASLFRCEFGRKSAIGEAADFGDHGRNVFEQLGKTSFEDEKLVENYAAALEEITRLKPSAAKGRYIKKAAISTTIGPGIQVDPNRTRNLLVEEDPAAV